MSLYDTSSGVTQVTVTVTVATDDADKARATVAELIRRSREDFRPVTIPAPYVREAIITSVGPTFTGGTPVDVDTLPADQGDDVYERDRSTEYIHTGDNV